MLASEWWLTENEQYCFFLIDWDLRRIILWEFIFPAALSRKPLHEGEFTTGSPLAKPPELQQQKPLLYAIKGTIGRLLLLLTLALLFVSIYIFSCCALKSGITFRIGITYRK